ncbi:hypothetical protein Taro_055322 [Colocasia esculenta]|uniref:CCHC-type domain-containing protein n=1 Tax=Colocasia esculenta TaxID=4460 RepID=A0A843XT40_COLES|nr:hypothetical protein [Colocasia esculenta]
MAGRGRRSAQSRRHEQSRKVKKFMKGLKPLVKVRLLELDPRSLEEVLGMANRQESRVESYQEEKEAQKEGVPKPFQRKDRKMKKLMESQQPTGVPDSEKPECIHCGKRHGGNACWRKEGRCFRCGSKDHRLRECPNQKTKFIPRDASSIKIKEPGLAGDDLGDVTTGETAKEMGMMRNAVRWVRSELLSIKESITALGDLVRAQSSNAPPTPSSAVPVRSSGPSEARQQDVGPSGQISEEPAGPFGPQDVNKAATAMQDQVEAVKSGPSGPIEDVSGPGPVVSEGEIPRVEEPVVAPDALDPSPLATPAPPSPPSSSTAPPAPITFKQLLPRTFSSPTPFPSESSPSPATSTSIPPPPPVS